MARKIPAKLVLELLGKGMSAREIQRTRHIAPQSVAKVRDAAEERRVGWEDVAKMDEAQVYELLFPREAEADKAFLAPDYAYVHTELQKTGVTMQLLHEGSSALGFTLGLGRLGAVFAPICGGAILQAGYGASSVLICFGVASLIGCISLLACTDKAIMKSISACKLRK